MSMTRLERNTGQHRHRERGFSLIEVLSVVAIIIVVASISVMSLVPMLKAQRVNNAYNTTIAALRQARDNAVSQRASYSVTFSNAATPNTIVVAPALATGGTTFQGNQGTVTYQLPTDVTFYAASALSSTPAPDSYGSGVNAIDLGFTANGVGVGNQKTIYFCPDGSAQDAEGTGGNCAGSWDGGVVYIARSTELLSSRAVTVWGGTGRIRGWRLYSNGSGGYQWTRQ